MINNSGKPYTKKELQLIRNMHLNGSNCSQIAFRVGRTSNGIKKILSKMKRNKYRIPGIFCSCIGTKKIDEDENVFQRRDYRSLLHAGNAAQMEKLRKNSHKEGFDDISAEYCKKRIAQELIELNEAVTPKEMRSEAADISNFCHMLIYACDKRE